MPVRDYGVWKAHPVYYTVERERDDPNSPHLSLYFHDHESGEPDYDLSLPREGLEIAGLFRAAINIKSGDPRDHRLAYWVNHNINQHAIVPKLTDLEFGFRSLKEGSEQRTLGLDYIRKNLFNPSSGRLLPHDVRGPFNDIIDVLEPNIQQAIEDNAVVYLFGARFNTRNGIHDVHMNQGNNSSFRRDDGVSQDGVLLIHFPSPDRWLGVFLASGSQAVHTDDQTGHATSRITWGDFLRPDTLEESVAIREVSVTRPGVQGSVTLANLTDHTVPIASWTLRNSKGDVQTLPFDASLNARMNLEVPDCVLSNQGDTIMLVNKDGFKVTGVSYNSGQLGGSTGRTIVFAH